MITDIDGADARGSSQTVTALAACNGTALRKAMRRITLMYDDALGPCGIRSTQFAILAALDEAAVPPTIGELADRLVMDSSALGHTLKPLEREGWVQLEVSTEDRRRKRLILTQAGQAQLREAETLWRGVQAKFEDVMGKEQSAALRAVLLTIAHDDRLGIEAAA